MLSFSHFTTRNFIYNLSFHRMLIAFRAFVVFGHWKIGGSPEWCCGFWCSRRLTVMRTGITKMDWFPGLEVKDCVKLWIVIAYCESPNGTIIDGSRIKQLKTLFKVNILIDDPCAPNPKSHLKVNLRVLGSGSLLHMCGRLQAWKRTGSRISISARLYHSKSK